MSQFLYYAPKLHKVATLDECEAVGAAYAFESKPAHRATQHGPDGGGGVVFGVDEGA